MRTLVVLCALLTTASGFYPLVLPGKSTCTSKFCPWGTVCKELYNTATRVVQAHCITDQNTQQKPGQCPRLLPGSQGICISNCRSDGECPGTRKCCRNPCGANVCLNPAQTGNIVNPQRPSCDRVQCGEGQTCVLRPVLCFSAPCYPQPVCVREVQDTGRIRKPGQCPRFPPGSFGICISNCYSDANCQGSQKCCQNPCGHNVCLNPVQTENTIVPHNLSCDRLQCELGATCVLRRVLCFRYPCYPQPVCVSNHIKH